MLIYFPMPGVVAYSNFTVVHVLYKRGLYKQQWQGKGSNEPMKSNYLISKGWIVIKDETVP
jgi:hypothetical protein